MTADQDVQVDFGVLGPLSVEVAGAPVRLPSAKTRVVLASLLLRPNRTVSVEELVDRLWDNDPPSGARNAAQSYVMRLRKTLGAAGSLISTQPAGYLISASAQMVDLGRFRSRIAAADAAHARSDAPSEARELRAALAIWRGTPIPDVPSELLHVQETQRLGEERLQALERLMDAELALGRHSEVIGELYALTESNLLRERFWYQLMLALYRAGRQADALSTYRKVAALLREELGIDPGDALRELHQQILGSTSPPTAATSAAPVTPAGSPPAQTAAGSSWKVPFQLPAGIPDFVGRDDLLTKIRALTTRTDDGSDGNSHAVPIVILSGPPGAGKTALAVHAAHRLRQEFPDGQLYVNLRGFSASPPLAVTDALGRFLRALGVAADHIPHEVDEQSTMLRSLLGGHKVLMVLDNAASPEQVRQLLPSDPSCAVLITSRNNLPGLTALNGARRLPVDMVSPTEATAMISKIVGADRVAAEPTATDELARTCALLPLSLRIAATNLAGSSGLTIAEYVRQLRSGSRLDAMEIEGDDQAAVRLVFDLSYSTLKPGLSQFFRLISLIPGPDFDNLAAAAVADSDLAMARRMLDQLAAANLIGSNAPGRFTFHDLIKEFAAERAQDQDTAVERAAALRGLFSFYLHWTYLANDLAYPDTQRVALPDVRPVVPAPTWAEPASAMSWLEQEAENLVALICAPAAEDLAVWSLADALFAYLERGRHDSIWHSAFTAALASAQRSGDARAQGAAHRGLARQQLQHAHYTEAEAHMAQAVDLFAAAGDVVSEARARNGLGAIGVDTGEFDKVIGHFEQSLKLVENGLDPAGQSTTLFGLGLTQIHLGLTASGTANLEKSRELASELGIPFLRTRCLTALALRDKWAGDLVPALHGFGKALDVWNDLGYTLGWVETVRNIADTSVRAGRPDLAIDIGRHVLAPAREIGWRWAAIGVQVVFGNAALALDDIEEAIRQFDAARASAGTGRSYWNCAVNRGMAAARRRSGDLAQAESLIIADLAAPLPRDRSQAYAELAAVLLARGDHQAAIDHAVTACRLAEEFGHRIELISALRILAGAQSGVGDSASAQATRQRIAAVPVPDRAEIDAVLAGLVARISASALE